MLSAWVPSWSAFVASLPAVRICCRWVVWPAISCCHSAAACATCLPRTRFGSIGSCQPQAANRAFRSSTAIRNSGVSGSGAVRGKPPEARKMRASSANTRGMKKLFSSTFPEFFFHSAHASCSFGVPAPV